MGLTPAGMGYMALSALVAFFAFYLLHLAPPQWKKRVIVGATFLAGLFYSLEFFLPEKSRYFIWLNLLFHGKRLDTNPLSPLVLPVGDFISVVGGFTIGLGVANLCLVHGRAVAGRRPGLQNSLAFFVGLCAMVGFGLWHKYGKSDFADEVYRVLYDGMLVPLQSAMFSVLAFFIASAAYRAFRVRTGEATLMMGAAFLIMLGQVPYGQWLTGGLPQQGWLSYLRLENLRGWIMEWVNMPALRAIAFGIGVGMLAMSLRIWLSLERGAFFEQEL